mmetsp:Transcript_7258/g.15712  ORF Transcript_7258/g.15712 Transcript_7258/m.15712 type:complete len:523 (+) Transcript_7258:139-1707(+)
MREAMIGGSGDCVAAPRAWDDCKGGAVISSANATDMESFLRSWARSHGDCDDSCSQVEASQPEALQALQALQAAVVSGHITSAGEALRQLATGGEDMLALLEGGDRDHEGRSLLHVLAAQPPSSAEMVGGCASICSLLVENCAYLGGENLMGETPLWLAVRAAIDIAEEEDGLVQVDWQVRCGIVRRLLELRADPNIGNSNDETPLMEASCAGDLDVCRLLLHFRAEVLSASRRGLTALDFASGQSEVEELLRTRRYGPETVDVVATEDSIQAVATTFQDVEQKGTEEAAEAVEAQGSRDEASGGSDSHSLDQAPWALDELVSALEHSETAAARCDARSCHAASRRASSAVRRFESAIIADIAGVEGETRAREPWWPPITSLHGADIVTEEICGAALQSRNQGGKLLLQLGQSALPDKHLADAVRWLITAKAHSDVANERGDTALAMAVRAGSKVLPQAEAEAAGRTEIVKVLLEARADPNIGNKEDASLPLMEAVCLGDTEMCALLLDAGSRFLVRQEYQI